MKGKSWENERERQKLEKEGVREGGSGRGRVVGEVERVGLERGWGAGWSERGGNGCVRVRERRRERRKRGRQGKSVREGGKEGRERETEKKRIVCG